MDLDAMRKLGAEPIAGTSPAGAPVRYDPAFEQLSKEIEKLTSVEQLAVDWHRVIDLATGLLRAGKDLLVGSYLACGLFERAGYAGLGAGCTLLRSFVDGYWDDLQPEKRRLRARIAAFEWLGARLEKALATRGDAAIDDRAGLDEAIGALEAIEQDPSGRFEGSTPNLAPAIRVLRGKLDSIPAPEAPPPAAAAQPVAAAPPPPPPSPPPDAKPADPAAVADALVKMRARQVEFAAVLREHDDTDPRSYLLLRDALWSDAGVTTADGQKLPGAVGDDAALAPLDADLDNGEFAAVLARAEAMLPEHPYWFDLQLVAARSLEGLGRRYARAHAAVVESLAFLLRRCPRAIDATNERGKALARTATRVWLVNEVLRGADAAAGGSTANDVGAEARRLVARGKLGDAMRLLTGRIDATASRRGRFVLRLELAKVCIEAGRAELAVPQLEQLEQEVTHFSLEEWEPDLATEVVRSLWHCCAGQKPAASLAARGQDIYARLCRLDPAAAVSANGPRGA